MPKHLFVCGCPRSGTTVLWRLLAAHPRIVLGLERYVLRSWIKVDGLTPDLFEKNRFFDLRPGDTFYESLSGHGDHYRRMEERFDDAVWVGDKSPAFYLQYDAIEKNFDNAHVIFIVRNIFDVAASYQARALNPNDLTWKKERDFHLAIADWQRSLETTLRFRRKWRRRTALTIVSYEELFETDGATVAPIFGALKLDVPPSVAAAFAEARQKSVELEARRELSRFLDMRGRQLVAASAPFDLYRLALKHRVPLATPRTDHKSR